MKTRWLSVPIFFLFLMASVANAGLISTFDEDNEGWTTYTSGSGVFIPAVHEDHYIEAEDTNPNNQYYFVAPGSWDGDWSDYIGGTLEYDIKTTPGYDDRYYDFGNEVVISSIYGSSMGHKPDVEPAIGAWTHFSVPLVAGSFGVSEFTFNYIMSSIGGLMIRGDYLLSINDTTALDNVAVGQVPAPATILLFGTGLLGLIGYRQKK